MAKRRHPELAASIAARIDQARVDAGYDVKGDFYLALRRDPGQMRRYLRGDQLPGVDFLIDVADVCGVSLDWLVLGHTEAPEALTQWIGEQPPARRADPDFKRTVRFLRSLPLRGWRPTPDFYAQVDLGIRHGLLEDVPDPADVVRAVRESDRHSR